MLFCFDISHQLYYTYVCAITPQLFSHFYLQSASTRSLFSILKKILDENIERKNGDIPNVWKL